MDSRGFWFILLLITLANTTLAKPAISALPVISGKKGCVEKVVHLIRSRFASLKKTAVMEPPKSLPETEQILHPLIPLKPKEMGKFVMLASLSFWVLFVFSLARDTKDTLIVTSCGAESIAFLKVYGVIPAATIFMLLYGYLSSKLSPTTLFYVILSPFFLFYLTFAFILYPARQMLHFPSWNLQEQGMSYLINLVRNWSFLLYYIVSELWGSAGVSLLFWACANDVVMLDQAKRFYPLLSSIGNLGPVLGGFTMTTVSQLVLKSVKDDDQAFEATLKIVSSIMAVVGLLIGTLFYFVNIFYRDQSKAVNEVKTSKSNKMEHLSFVDSLRVLSSDSYLMNLATMVLSYGLLIEFTEIIWKAAVKSAFPVKSDYLSFMGRYSILVGSFAFVGTFVGTYIVRKFGWKGGAVATPVAMGALALPFFVLVMQPRGSTTLLLSAVYLGLVQNALSKASKYSIFDPVKEMAYIPLDTVSKTRGKAAIDVLGARLGKSGGALIQQLLILGFGNIFSGAPILSILFYVLLLVWIGAANKLAPQFESLTKEKST